MGCQDTPIAEYDSRHGASSEGYISDARGRMLCRHMCAIAPSVNQARRWQEAYHRESNEVGGSNTVGGVRAGVGGNTDGA